jgi:hypothetical protein
MIDIFEVFGGWGHGSEDTGCISTLNGDTEYVVQAKSSPGHLLTWLKVKVY